MIAAHSAKSHGKSQPAVAKRGQAGGQIPLAKPRVRLALFGSLSLHLADVEFDVRCRKVRALVDYEIEPSAATQELAVAIKRWLIGTSGDCIALIRQPRLIIKRQTTVFICKLGYELARRRLGGGKTPRRTGYGTTSCSRWAFAQGMAEAHRAQGIRAYADRLIRGQ